MRRSNHFRDYLYISARKVVRMSKALRPEAWKRVSEMQVKLGPVGASMSFSLDSHAEEVIALVPEVECAIAERFGIKKLDDSDLQVGQWFEVPATNMTYGIPGIDGTGVIFIAQGQRPFLLGGSADYLLDRQVTVERSGAWGHSASGLRGIRDLLDQLSREELRQGPAAESDDMGVVPSHSPDTEFGKLSRGELRRDFERFDEIREVFGTSGEPLIALARCLSIEAATTGSALVVGTPLYVAFQPPS